MEQSTQLRILVMYIQVALVYGDHFRGGIISMSPLHSTNKTMEVSLHVSYARRHVYTATCDQRKVNSGSLYGSHPRDQGIFCVQGCESKDLVSLIRYRCTDFSTTESWEYGENKIIYTFNNASRVTLSAKGCCWLRPFNTGSWDLFISMDLSVRPDTLKINSAPKARFFPVVKIQSGCNSTLNIAPYDPDGDVIRCRWGNETTKECAGICNGFPGAVLDPSTCCLFYSSPITDDNAFKAVAIMMEDFAVDDYNFKKPFSTVALNFLVNLYKSDLACEEARPQFIAPTPYDYSCIAIPAGQSYNGHIVVQSIAFGTEIKEIHTVVPSGVRKSSLTPMDKYSYVNITWMPEERDYFQNNNNVESMCFSAVSSNGQNTREQCVQWMAGSNAPIVTSPTNSEELKVGPYSPEFPINFDQVVHRGVTPAKVRFFLSSSKTEVYSITVNNNNGKALINFLGNQSVIISTLYKFEELQTYTMSLDGGFAKGEQGCGPDSAVSVDLVNIFIMDVTAPSLQFKDLQHKSNNSIVIGWSFNEEVTTVQCSLKKQSDKNNPYELLSSNDCKNGMFSNFDLTEGQYRLDIKAIDLYGNVGLYFHLWYADLTPPEVTLVIPFKGHVTNQVEPVFHLSCNRGEKCKFKCRYGLSIDNLRDINCESGICKTPGDATNVSYLHYSAEDEVGNQSPEKMFMWIIDLVPPTINLDADSLYSPCTNLSRVPQPSFVDNIDTNPILTFRDDGDSGSCEIRRTWEASDEAGNSKRAEQRIVLTFTPVLNFIQILKVPCDPEKATVIPKDTANADNICGRMVNLHYEDSSSQANCPDIVTRTWFYKDSCSPSMPEKTAIQNIKFFETCPATACGRQHTPPHGICIDGVCSCSAPWYGVNCEKYIIAPAIVPPETTREIHEWSEYEQQLSLSEGTYPVMWKMNTTKKTMEIDKGTITWDDIRDVGKFHIEVTAENPAGNASVSLNLIVLPAYKTFLNQIQNNLFIKSTSTLITGYIEYETSELSQKKPSNVPVEVLIRYRASTRQYITETKVDRSFQVMFEPLLTEYGLYEVISKHPQAKPTEGGKQWKVLGMKFLKQSLTIKEKAKGEVDFTLNNITLLNNDGPQDLSDVRVESVRGLSNGIELNIFFNGQQNIPTLIQGSKIAISLNVKSPSPFDQIRAFIEVKSSEGVTALLIINLMVVNLKPKLAAIPSELEVEVLRGSQEFVPINITNAGEAIAESVVAKVPNIDLISVVSFGNSTYASDPQNLSPGKFSILNLRISPKRDSELGLYHGSFPISSDGHTINFPIRVIVISNELATVFFIVEDEYTYFADDRPLVDKATVRLNNRNRGISLTDKTDRGNVRFTDIPEETYDVYVSAPNHQGIKSTFQIKSGSNSFRIFLKRTAVTYRWTVTPTEVKDVYKIKIEADFETRVPIPVVTITPMDIDLEPYELGLKDSIQFNVTNHGLIRAEQTKLNLPQNHPLLEFNILGQPKEIDALSSVLIPVQVSRKENGRRKRSSPCSFSGSFDFGYECGDWILRNIHIEFNVKVACEGRGPTGGPGGGGGAFFLRGGGGGSAKNIFCDPCFQSFVECAWSYIPFVPSIATLHSYANVLSGNPSDDDLKAVEDYASGLIEGIINDAIKGLAGGKSNSGGGTSGSGRSRRSTTRTIKEVGKAAVKRIWNLVEKCLPGIAEKCGLYDYLPPALRGPAKELTEFITSFGRKKRDVKQSAVSSFVKAMEPFTNLLRWKKEVYGDDTWLLGNNRNWLERYYFPLIADDSELGKGISPSELVKLITYEPPHYLEVEDVIKFVHRWNSSYFSWQSGRLEPDDNNPDIISNSAILHYKSEIVRLNKLAVNTGYGNFVDQLNVKVSEVKKLNPDEPEEAGVCAVVRIQIDQELALTREGFLAKLEIENGERAELKNITVSINIENVQTGEEAKLHFSIGNGTIGGDMKADRSLGSQKKGEIEWLLIPYSSAAPVDDAFYDVGGTLYYEVDGSEISAPLLPGRIGVKPDPRLNIYYFWEKFVYSDDPFTDKVEPAIPYMLVVAVKNSGNGTAYKMHITSSQPEIIENEKGLYVDFKMIGASVGNQNVTPSLTVNFGDVLPSQTVIAKWWMVCSLKGKFQNYSASFENENPLGDPRLSLIDELVVKELIHEVIIVDIDGEMDDFGDFLVNEDADLDVVPDNIYSSLTMNNFSVSHQNAQDVSVTKDRDSQFKVFLNVTSDVMGFVYYRESLPFPESEQISLNSLSIIKQSIGGNTKQLPNINAWVTTMIGEKAKNFLVLHVFDYIVDVEVGYAFNYTVTFGDDFQVGNVVLKPTKDPPTEVDLLPVPSTELPPIGGTTYKTGFTFVLLLGVFFSLLVSI